MDWRSQRSWRGMSVLLLACGVLLGVATIAVAQDARHGSAAPIDQLHVDAARLDLASNLGLSLDEIAVVAADEVDWPDRSLGCPRPGYFYPQVITPGFRVVLDAAGIRYVYHTDRGQLLVTCESPEPAPDGAPEPPEHTCPPDSSLPSDTPASDP